MVCYLVQCPQFELLPSPYPAIVTYSLLPSTGIQINHATFSVVGNLTILSLTAGNYLLFVDVWHFRFHTHKGVKNGQPLDVAASNGGAKAVIFVMISQLQQESQTKSTRTP